MKTTKLRSYFSASTATLMLLTTILLTATTEARVCRPSCGDLDATLESGSWGLPKWYFDESGKDVPMTYTYRFKNQQVIETLTCHFTESIDHNMSKDVTVRAKGDAQYADGVISIAASTGKTETLTENGKTETCAIEPGNAWTGRYSFTNDGTLLMLVLPGGGTALLEKR